MKNILIFTREMLPYCNSVGSSIRIVTLASYLGKTGFNVKILAAKGVKVSYWGLEDQVSKLDVKYLEDGLQNYYTNKANEVNSIDIPIDDKNTYLGIVKAQIKKCITSISIPDIGIFYLPKFIIEAIKIIINNNIDILIVSSPPHSSQILGFFLKKIFKKKIFLIVDYRDGWNTFTLFKSNNFIRHKFEKYIEKKILDCSDLFLHQSPVVLKQIKSQYYPVNDYISNKSLLIRNGYTLLEKKEENGVETEIKIPKDSKYNFKIGYFGGMDLTSPGYRNPIIFLQTLEENKINADFYIYGSAPGHFIFERFRNLKIHFMGQVPLAIAKMQMKIFDALFVFHADVDGGEEVIPGKFYEYIDAEIPILVYGPDNMECGNIVEEKQLGIYVRIQMIKSEITKIKLFFKNTNKEEYIKNIQNNKIEFSRDYQYKKLIDKLDSIF